MRSSMLRRIIRVAVLLLMLCGTTTGWGQESSQGARPDELEFEPLRWSMQTPDKISLENGIRMFHQNNAELPLVEITLMVGVGRSVENATNTGLMQLFARALANGGTRKIPASEFDAMLDALAINLNVDTGPYTTTLQMSVMREDLQKGMELLSKLVRTPGFDSERFETARQQLIEQVRRRLDNPGAIAEQLMLEQLYPDHPLGRKPTLETLGSIKRTDLLQLHQRYFGPANMYVAISGDIDGDAATQLVDANFASWKQKVKCAEVPALKELSGGVEFGPLIVAQRPLSQTTIRLVERGIKRDNPDVYAVEIMNYILGGGGFNSRLMREIRSNRGLAYSVFSHFSVGRRLQGAFFAGCETKAESVAEAVGLFASIMQEMREEGVTEEELQLAKQSQINSFVFRFENPHSLVTKIMEYDFYGYPEDYLTRYREHIRKVTAQDVQRVAKKYLHPERQAVILVGDIGEEEIAALAHEREVENINPQDLL
ncbi:MAG: insulinase family protein [Geobacteraceae bacterium]|nr:insulinase family protein [Geobacteraceae bacterium]